MNENTKKILKISENNFNNIEVISKNQIIRKEYAIPKTWINIISCPMIEWKSRILNLWNSFSKILPLFYATMKKYLIDVQFVHADGNLYILYLFEINGNNFVYKGGNPNQAINTPVDEEFNKLPKQLLKFYSELHNGFVFLPAGSLGPMPKERLFLLSDEDWGWMENEQLEIPINLSKTIAIFNSGGGGYLCIDTSQVTDNDDTEGIVWWADESPDKEKFWPTLDAWMQIGLEG